jgi:hypothetical protein
MVKEPPANDCCPPSGDARGALPNSARKSFPDLAAIAAPGRQDGGSTALRILGSKYPNRPPYVSPMGHIAKQHPLLTALRGWAGMAFAHTPK